MTCRVCNGLGGVGPYGHIYCPACLAADELEAAGWPSVAADVREGVPLETVLSRLHSIGEGESEAAEIVTSHG